MQPCHYFTGPAGCWIDVSCLKTLNYWTEELVNKKWRRKRSWWFDGQVDSFRKRTAAWLVSVSYHCLFTLLPHFPTPTPRFFALVHILVGNLFRLLAFFFILCFPSWSITNFPFHHSSPSHYSTLKPCFLKIPNFSLHPVPIYPNKSMLLQA